jgi:hypothetical protein
MVERDQPFRTPGRWAYSTHRLLGGFFLGRCPALGISLVLGVRKIKRCMNPEPAKTVSESRSDPAGDMEAAELPCADGAFGSKGRAVSLSRGLTHPHSVDRRNSSPALLLGP